MQTVMILNVSEVVIPAIQNNLRTSLQFSKNEKDKEKFAGIMASIERDGQIQPVTVRKAIDGEKMFVFDPLTGETSKEEVDVSGKWILADGVQRYCSCANLGITVKALEIDADEQRREELAIIANLHRAGNKTGEIARLIKTWFVRDKIGFGEIAKRLSKPIDYVESLFRINTLDKGTKDLIDAGKISTGNAIALVRALPKYPERREEIIAAAQGTAEQLKSALDTIGSQERVYGRSSVELKRQVFVFNESFSMEKVLELKEQCDLLKEEAELDGHGLTGEELGICKAIDIIYQRTQEEKDKALREWQEKMNKLIAAAEAREAKAKEITEAAKK